MTDIDFTGLMLAHGACGSGGTGSPGCYRYVHLGVLIARNQPRICTHCGERRRVLVYRGAEVTQLSESGGAVYLGRAPSPLYFW
jgi:hypothetical protein